MMEGITGILIFMGIGSILGLIVGNLIWYKDHKRIKLQEQIIDHYKGLSDYFQKVLVGEGVLIPPLTRSIREGSDVPTNQSVIDRVNVVSEIISKQRMREASQKLNDTMKELERVANEYEAEHKGENEPMVLGKAKEHKLESIDQRYLIILVDELKMVQKEIEDVLENAPRRFGWIEYKKARKIEALQQALRQIIYFDRIQESEAMLPKTPETCPKCGAKLSGGATHPGEDMIPDARVFYICGASISLRNWGEENTHVLLKNCSSFEEAAEKYPVIFGRLVHVTIKDPIEFFEAGTNKKVKDV